MAKLHFVKSTSGIAGKNHETDDFILGLELGEDFEVELKKSGRANSWSMKKTWRMWMSETGRWMAANGAIMPLVMRNGKPWGKRPFNAQDAHELFVSTYLGVDGNGHRYKTASGDKGKMLNMMDRHVAWCVEKGIKLTIPADGEYMKCKAAQEG